MGKTGARFTLDVNSRLIFDDAGAPVGIHSIARDVTERKDAEARQALLVRELQHRAKNLLAVMQSITSSTLSTSSDLQTAHDTILGRLQALARAQDFIASGPSGGVPIDEIVRGELALFGRGSRWTARRCLPVAHSRRCSRWSFTSSPRMQRNTDRYRSPRAASMSSGTSGATLHLRSRGSNGADHPCTNRHLRGSAVA